MTEKKLLMIHEKGIEITDDELYKKVTRGNLSASMANSFLNCPADWLLDRHIMPKIEHEEPIYFARGTAFHKVMERFFTMAPTERNPKSLAKLTMFTLENDYPDLNSDPESVEWMKNCVRSYLKMGLDYRADIVPQVNIDGRGDKIGLELFVKGKFGTERPVVGFIDKLGTTKDSNGNTVLSMQDWKTGGKVHNYNPDKPIGTNNSFDYPRQQTLYAMMLEKEGIKVNDASLIFPVANEVITVDVDNKQFQDQAIEDMQKLDKYLDKCIKDNFFPFTPATFCTWCHLLYSGRTVGRRRTPKININELNQLVDYDD